MSFPFGRQSSATAVQERPQLRTAPPVPAALSGRERRAAKKAEYQAARTARANRPTSRGWRRPGGGAVPWVEAPPEYRGTTVQVCGLWPFAAGSGTPVDGVPLGLHERTGATVCGDPIFWFLSGRIANPSAFVLGRPGLGKSTLVRRIVNIATAFGVYPLILADLKPDYPDLVEALGGQVITLGRGRGHINPLDPGPLYEQLHTLDEATRRRVLAEQEGRALNVLFGLCEIVRGAKLSDLEENILTAALRVAKSEVDGTPLIADVLAVIDAKHPRVRAVARDRGEDTRYADNTDAVASSLTGLGPEGRFGDIFAGHTTVPMRLDRAVCFDVSSIDDAETKLQAAVQLVCWSYGQSGVIAAKELADAGLRPQQIYLLIMDELWRILRASPEIIDRIDAITRLNRQKGIGQIMITHTMNDLKLPGEGMTEKAWGFVERSEMVFLGGLANSEMGNLEEVFDMSGREKMMISDWSVPGTVGEDGQRNPPPGLGAFLLKIGKTPGTPLRVKLTATEESVNDTNKSWHDIAARHRSAA